MKVIIYLFFSASIIAGNGNEVGNGGDGVECSDKSIQLLDFFEAKKIYKRDLKFPIGKNWFEVAKNTFKRIENLSPQFFRQYSKVLSKLKDDLVFVDKAKLRDVKDSWEIALPEGCKLVQLAIQKNDSKGRIQTFISQKYWDRLSVHNRAGLITHEIIYEHFLHLGEKNSIKARNLNSFLYSKKTLSIKANDFKKYLNSLKLSIY